MPRSVVSAVLALSALLGGSACAPTSTGSAGVGDVHDTQTTYGVIVSVRPVPDQAGGSSVRGSILMAVGSAGPPSGTGQACEFIIRDDSGRPLSVVQSNADGLRPGERVVIATGDRARLSRATN